VGVNVGVDIGEGMFVSRGVEVGVDLPALIGEQELTARIKAEKINIERFILPSVSRQEKSFRTSRPTGRTSLATGSGKITISS
jgi:tetrahydrodipicolinate N-succinyltransferase